MHPVLFRIGPFELYTYGALLAVAFLVALYLAMREGKNVGVSEEFVADEGIVIILSSIVGARLFFILFYDLQNTLAHPAELLRLRQAGLVFYGGLILAVVAGLIFCRLKRVSIPVVVDVAAPSIAIGQALGRIGCFMSGCCYGKPTWVPWAVRFPTVDQQARHPTQIYESLATFGIFLALIWFRKRKTRDGQVMCLYAILYAAVRIIIEFLRGDNPHIFFGLTISQIISAVVLAAAVAMAFVLWIPLSQKPAHADR
jgi:phosphatidylglycerol:prolipoprotein diacylglycerol transferase